MAENGSLLGKVEKVLRALAGCEVEQDGEKFTVTVGRVSRETYRAAASIINANGRPFPKGEVVALFDRRKSKPTFDEVESALLDAARAEVQKQRAALDAAVGE